jgi:hypothetical protein
LSEQPRLTRRPVENHPDLAADFVAMMDRWHSLPEVYDDELDAQIHEQYVAVLRRKFRFPRQPYFTPSSIDMCPRANYLRLTGATRDKSGQPPHQGRWTRMGTAFGDVMQRDLLFIEKHWPRIFGESAPFTVERNEHGEPMWEQFARAVMPITHGDHTFSLFALPDGVLRHTATGKRVLVEFKSKQTTSSRTSEYSMKGAEDKHADQTVSYSIAYNVDDRIIVYGNLSKKAWFMTEEEYAKSPDLRAFHEEINNVARWEILDRCANILDAVAAKTPPPLDLDKWTFNGYKTACALSLTGDELNHIRSKVAQVQTSGLKPKVKEDYAKALADIESIRAEHSEMGAVA